MRNEFLYEATIGIVEIAVRKGKGVVLTVKSNIDQRFDEPYEIHDLVPDPLSMGNTHRIYHSDEEGLKKLGVQL